MRSVTLLLWKARTQKLLSEKEADYGQKAAPPYQLFIGESGRRELCVPFDARNILKMQLVSCLRAGVLHHDNGAHPGFCPAVASPTGI